LLDRVVSELTTIKQVLATAAHPSAARVAPYLSGVAEQSEQIAAEAERLQGFARAFVPPSLDAGKG
jgi:hypothetical protein